MVVLALSGVAAFGLAPDTTLESVATVTVLRELPRPALAPVDAAATAGYWREERSSAAIPSAGCLPGSASTTPQALAFLRTDPAARPLYQLRPDKPLRVETDEDGALLELRFVAGNGNLLSITRDGERFDRALHRPRRPTFAGRWPRAKSARRCSAPPTQPACRTRSRCSSPTCSPATSTSTRPARGDRFTVVYEMRYVDGEAVGPGRIVAAEFDNRGKTYRAFLWRDADGAEDYYAARRHGAAQGVPALADGVLAGHVGLLERALPSDPSDVARAQGRRLRGAGRHAGPRHRQRQRRCSPGSAGRLRQRGRAAAPRHVLDALRAPVALRVAACASARACAGRS